MASQETVVTTLKPLGNRVLVKRVQSEEKIRGGILLPDSAKKKQETAEVVAVGPGLQSKDGQIHSIPLQQGDKILLDKYAGQEVTINDQEFVIVKFEDVIAVIN
ncbi:MAG: co-chaperone GroES [Chlamydiae bacterium]|nr:co-chaperone GroES [Chlamydiota bacterium]